MKIYIDPGHGGNDPGAIGYGLYEKDLTLSIALRLRAILINEYEGIEVRMSRDADKSVSLDERTDDANAWGADYLISIHINAGGGEGFEIHTYNGSYDGKAETNRKANIIRGAILEATGFIDRGCKESNFHMVRESNMASSLSENGFIDTKQDAARLKSNDFLDAIARGHADGLERALDLNRKEVKSLGEWGELTDKEYERLKPLEEKLRITDLEDPDKPATQKYVWEIIYAYAKQDGRI